MVGFAFAINKLVAPHHPNPEKLTSYECGEEPTGNAWLPFNSRFYVIALIFLLFDVEMVFIFPWAVVFGNHDLIAQDHRWGWFALTEMFIFLGILILGLAYVWVKGDLDWIKPNPVIPVTEAKVPQNLYARLNTEQGNFKVKPFSLETSKTTEAIEKEVVKTEVPSTAPKLKFKPTFKKPANE